jgi:hypothetical protein
MGLCKIVAFEFAYNVTLAGLETAPPALAKYVNDVKLGVVSTTNGPVASAAFVPLAMLT